MTSQPPIQPPHSDLTPSETIVDSTEHRLRPLPKKDTAKAWLLTLILHFIIAGGLVSYWYMHQRNTEVAPIAVQLPTENTNKTNASQPSDTMAASATTLSTVVTVASTVASAPSGTASATPLASYLAQKPLAAANPANLPSNKVDNTTTSAPRMVAVTTMTQKVITGDAPIKKALTQRDIPTSPTDLTTAPTTDNDSGNEVEKEASKLSKDIDVNNDELSQLIEQVKKKNQQKIDEQQANIAPAKPTVSESNANDEPKSETKAVVKPESVKPASAP